MRIGTTLDVTRTAQELADVCVPALADFVTIDLLDPQEYGGEPPARVTPPAEAAPRRPPVRAPRRTGSGDQARHGGRSTRPFSRRPTR